MKIAFFDSRNYEKSVFDILNIQFKYDITYFETRLTEQTAHLARDFPIVCSFVNDQLNQNVLTTLANGGVKLIALRSAGFNHIDLKSADLLGLKVVRVPEYSPYAVAEHAVALILSLNRKIHRAYNRVREANFSLDGLCGFDLNQKTVGVIGTGRIGAVFAKIMISFGCNVLAFDHKKNEELEKCGIKYVTLDEIMKKSDIISLHVPLTPETKYLINQKTLTNVKPHLMLINTSRGGLINTRALIDALKSKRIGYAGLDVYEEEEGIFFEDLSENILLDDQLARLLTFPNVIVTSHQGFLTTEALENIAATTLKSIADFKLGNILQNEISIKKLQ